MNNSYKSCTIFVHKEANNNIRLHLKHYSFWCVSLQGPGPNCEGYKEQHLTQKEKDSIVRKHNELRRKVAKGQEQRGVPGPQPTASDMAELVSTMNIKNTYRAYIQSHV
jgi:hypothetical protein